VQAAALGLLAWPAASYALGLGPLAGDTVIGETLVLTVPLTGTIDRPVDSECVSVRRSPDSIDPEYFPRDLAVRVDRQAGTPRLLITTQSALRQPIVEFRVSVTCGYNLSHDYVLMAAPRAEPPATAPAADGTTASSAAAPTTAPAVRSTPTEAPVVVAPAVGAGGGLPDGIGGRNIVLANNMTLEDLARQHFPGPLRQQRFMRWVAEANPQYFAGAKDLRHQQLPGGAQLVIPEGVPPRRPGDHKGALNPIGEPNADYAGAAPRPTPRADSGAAPARPRSTGDRTKDRLVVGSGPAAKSMKETIALVDQLTGMMEKQMNAQSAYAEKVQQLEATIGDLDRQIKGLQAEAREQDAKWQAERQAEKAAREQQAEREWWQLLIAVAAGGVLGGGLLWAARSALGRRQEPAQAFEEFPVETAAPATRPAMPPTATPKAAPSDLLTGFGWDDEPQAQNAAIKSPAPKLPAYTADSAPVSAAAVSARKAEPVEFELPPNVLPSADLTVQEPTDPATAAIELANIMTSMGLAQSAAETLVEHIRENPRESLPQWLKLLEIHRLNGNRADFERSANEMRQHFNVQPDDWNASPHGRTSLESYPHIRSQVVKLWRKPECTALLRALLLDNREGTRVGFPLQVAEEILLLVAILNSTK